MSPVDAGADPPHPDESAAGSASGSERLTTRRPARDPAGLRSDGLPAPVGNAIGDVAAASLALSRAGKEDDDMSRRARPRDPGDVSREALARGDALSAVAPLARFLPARSGEDSCAIDS